MNFLKLPGEIRNRMYRELVVADSPIHILELNWTKDGTGYRPALTSQPAVARTCSTIRQEVMSLYCGENVFQFGATSGGHQLSMTEVSEALVQWIFSLGDSAKHLRQVTISANCEIMGPRNAAYWLRDFWEIIEFSVNVNGNTGLQYQLKGDPSFDELCTCELDHWVSEHSPRLADILLRSSRLWFKTTNLEECDACNRPCLREPVKVNGYIYIS